MKKIVFCLSMVISTSVFANKIDDCYSTHSDLREASRCADNVLLKRVKKQTIQIENLEDGSSTGWECVITAKQNGKICPFIGTGNTKASAEADATIKMEEGLAKCSGVHGNVVSSTTKCDKF